MAFTAALQHCILVSSQEPLMNDNPAYISVHSFTAELRISHNSICIARYNQNRRLQLPKMLPRLTSRSRLFLLFLSMLQNIFLGAFDNSDIFANYSYACHISTSDILHTTLQYCYVTSSFSAHYELWGSRRGELGT